MTLSHVLLSWPRFHDPLPPYPQQGHTNSTDRRPGFAEMWQDAGFGKDVGKQNSRLQSDSAKPEDAAAEASNPSSPTLSLTPLFPCCQPVGLLFSSVKCEGWLQRLMCVSQKFPHTRKVKRVSSSLGERNLIPTLCSSTLLSLPSYFLPPS